MEKISGYVVLRKPECAYDEGGRKEYPNVMPVEDKYYGGCDRMPWFDVWEAEYLKRLTVDEIVLIRSMKKKKPLHSDFYFEFDLHAAQKLLAISNRRGERNELCVLYSKTMEEAFGVIECACMIAWHGFDILHSSGSFLKEGIFKRPDLFRKFIPMINRYGLFDNNPDLIADYTQAYHECANNTKNYLEPIPPKGKFPFYYHEMAVGKVVL